MANERATLTFLGAAGTVTGSKHLLTLGERRILIDAGMFQGEKEWRLKNWEDFPIDPASISGIILTHAHADHSGYLPALVARGFNGPIWMTDGTRKLVEIVLRDSAHLQEQEAMEANEGGYSKHEKALPLYTTADVEKTLPLMKIVPFEQVIDLGDGVTAEWGRAAHILGSASVVVRYGDASVLFSGDLGRHDHPILKPRDTTVPSAPYVLMESTYGDREHPEPEGLEHEKMADAIRRTIERGGTILIPAFAIDRTELVLKQLTEMRRAGRIPEVPIWVNSPMALSALDAYRDSTDELRDDIKLEDFADLPTLREARTTDESKALTDPNGKHEPSIIISSSGMATGGRVVHHLAQLLPDKKNTVILTGYQGVGTRGRMLLDGVDKLKMFGKYVPVNAEIVQDSEFSVHGDATDLVEWLASISPKPQTVFMVHGEEKAAKALGDRIQRELGITTVIPKHGEVISLDPSGYQVLDEGISAEAANRGEQGQSSQPKQGQQGSKARGQQPQQPQQGRPVEAAGQSEALGADAYPPISPAPTSWDRGDGTTAGTPSAPGRPAASEQAAAAPQGQGVPAQPQSGQQAPAGQPPAPAAPAAPGQAPNGLRYQVITGSGEEFSRQVSRALEAGYQLQGAPVLSHDANNAVVLAQAVIWPN